MTKLPFADNSSEGLWSLLSPRPPKMVSDWNLSFSSIFHVVAVVLVFVVVLFTEWLTLQWLVCWNPAQSIELSRHYRLFWCVSGRYEADNIWHRINNYEKKNTICSFVCSSVVVVPHCDSVTRKRMKRNPPTLVSITRKTGRWKNINGLFPECPTKHCCSPILGLKSDSWSCVN